MNLITWIIFGAIAGYIASLITKSGAGIVMDIILGIIGALLGGFIMNFFGLTGVNGFNLRSLIVAIVGAIILVSIGKVFQKKTV